MQTDPEIERFVSQLRDQIEKVPTVYRHDILKCVGEALPMLLQLRVDFLRNFHIRQLLDQTEGPITPEQVDYQSDISHMWGKVSRVLSPRPPVTSSPCPVCSCEIRSDECEGLLYCTQCYTAYHESCFWRVLPLDEFLAYWSWLKRADDQYHLDYICAACREREIPEK